MASVNASSSSTYYAVDPYAGNRDALASTSTLVHEGPPLSLVFDRNSVIGATLYGATGPAYRIASSSSVTRTDLHVLTAPDDRVVATIKRRDLFPDLVVFAHRGAKPVKIKKWLRQRKAPRGEWELETLSGSFIWRSNRSHRFALYPNGQIPMQSPIAYADMLQDPPTLALVLRAGYEDIEVEVITSFIILEHKLRMREKIEQGELMLALTGNGVFFSVGF